MPGRGAALPRSLHYGCAEPRQVGKARDDSVKVRFGLRGGRCRQCPRESRAAIMISPPTQAADDALWFSYMSNQSYILSSFVLLPGGSLLFTFSYVSLRPWFVCRHQERRPGARGFAAAVRHDRIDKLSRFAARERLAGSATTSPVPPRAYPGGRLPSAP